jgi:hypothetical protein
VLAPALPINGDASERQRNAIVAALKAVAAAVDRGDELTTAIEHTEITVASMRRLRERETEVAA